MITEYIGLAEKVDDGYSVFFPDFPGFGSAGNTLEEARNHAKAGLIAHTELMMEEEEIMPKPMSLDQIMKLPDAKGCVPIMVSIITPTSKAQRINITLDGGLLDEIDAEARRRHLSRSALIAVAAQHLLAGI